eukprot:Awhi_evm1s13887
MNHQVSLFTLYLASYSLGASVQNTSIGPNNINAYAPVVGQCTNQEVNGQSVRVAESSLSSEESSWMSKRDQVIQKNWVNYFENVAEDILGLKEHLSNDSKSSFPRVAITSSGGGTRAMLVGAGVFSSFDSHDKTAIENKSGGIFDISSYVVGLSGSSWLVSSLLVNNFPVPSQWAKESINLDTTVFAPGESDAQIVKNYEIFDAQITAKQTAGFNVSLVDLWGRGISYQILNPLASTSYGVDIRLSDFATDQDNLFYTADCPFPILLSTQLFKDESAKASGQPWEMSPFETGSFSPDVNAFVNTGSFGTTFDNLNPVDDTECTKYFDNLGFLFGTSSAAFALSDPGTDLPWEAQLILEKYMNGLEKLTLAPSPNPFYGLITNQNADAKTMYLGDGGLGSWGNIPLFPVLVPERNVDVIFAIDSSNDVNGLPSGNAIVRASNYSALVGVPFPSTPDQSYFDQNPEILQRVTFFGCNETAPTIIYIPNHVISYPTNTSTFQFAYNQTEIEGFLKNSQDMIYGQPGYEDLP